MMKDRATPEDLLKEIEDRVKFASSVFIFGAGRAAFDVCLWLKNDFGIDAKAFFDNDPQKEGNDVYERTTVRSVDSLNRLFGSDDLMIVSVLNSKHICEIKRQLLDLGVRSEQIISYQEYLDVRAQCKIFKITTECRKKSSRRIKVGFAIYELETWDKLSPLYESMIKDEAFIPFLFVLPKYDCEKQKITEDSHFEEFKQMYPQQGNYVIDTRRNTFAIEVYDLDYLFLPAPYDSYVPEAFKSDVLVSKVRLCYIPYGYNGAINFIDNNTIRGFFRNIYLDFSPTKEIHSVIENIFSIGNKGAISKSYMLGCPSLEKAYMQKKENDRIATVMWTPRWSYDPKIGGSHFFEYKNVICNIKKAYPDIRLIVRPHPMMFKTFVREGLMSDKDINDYRALLKKENIEISEGRELYSDLEMVDLLITDFSTIILPFFLCEKPIIYCNHPNIILNNAYSLLRDGMYIVDDEKGLVEAFEELLEVGDIKFDERLKIKEMFRGEAVRVCERIKHVLIENN